MEINICITAIDRYIRHFIEYRSKFVGECWMLNVQGANEYSDANFCVQIAYLFRHEMHPPGGLHLYLH